MLTAERTRTAVILAGGQSRRFGRDKVWADVDGTPLIQKVIQPLEKNGWRIVLSGPKEKLAPLTLPIIEDEAPGCGPLSALATILHAFNEEKLLLLACDTPFVPPGVCDHLWTIGRTHDVALLPGNRLWEPLPAVYSRTCLPPIIHLLGKGRRDLSALSEMKLTVGQVGATTFAQIDPERKSFWNINRKVDLKLLESIGN